MDIRLNRFIDMPSNPMAASFEWFAAQALPRLQSAGGFSTIFFGMDLDAGTAAGVTFWDSERSRRNSEQVERTIREDALARAAADPSRGLIDAYHVRYAHRAYRTGDCLSARMARWEGLPPEPARELLHRWLDDDVPTWQADPAYEGLIVATNRHLGNILMISMWNTSALERTVALEDASRSWLEPALTGPLRPIHVDTYTVALAPDLPADPGAETATWDAMPVPA